MSPSEPIHPMHELIDARAEGTALRDSALVLESSLRHLARQFLLFAAALLFALVLAFLGLREVGGGLRDWFPGLCVVLGFGVCAFLVQYLRAWQILEGTRLVRQQIDRAINESMVVIDSKT